MMRNQVLSCLLLVLAACDAAKDQRTSCSGAPGSITDLTAEPAYSAAYLHRWSVDGCAVRLDVLMSRDSGCGPEDLVMGSPLGAIAEGVNARIYVRGDTTMLGGGAMGFQLDAVF